MLACPNRFQRRFDGGAYSRLAEARGKPKPAWLTEAKATQLLLDIDVLDSRRAAAARPDACAIRHRRWHCGREARMVRRCRITRHCTPSRSSFIRRRSCSPFSAWLGTSCDNKAETSHTRHHRHSFVKVGGRSSSNCFAWGAAGLPSCACPQMDRCGPSRVINAAYWVYPAVAR